MVDPIKGSAEINRHDPSLPPTLQCDLQCMGQAQKYITCNKTLLISNLSSWKRTTALNKSSWANLHRTLNTFDNANVVKIGW